MADAPSLASQAAKSGNYPSTAGFNKREQQLLETVKEYVDASSGGGAATIVAADVYQDPGAGSGDISVPGSLTTDLVFMNIQLFGAGTVSVKSAYISADGTLSYVLNNVDDVTNLSYMVVRPS